MVRSYLNRAKGDVVNIPDKGQIDMRRVVAAFIMTPASISLAVAFVMPLYGGLPNYGDRVLRSWLLYVIFAALPATIVLGIPAFMILKKLLRLSLLSCAAVGAVIAALPWFLIGLVPTPGSSAWTGGHATVIDGHYTSYGWLEFAQSILIIAACGAVGGIIFWLIAAAKLPRKQTVRPAPPPLR